MADTLLIAPSHDTYQTRRIPKSDKGSKSTELWNLPQEAQPEGTVADAGGVVAAAHRPAVASAAAEAGSRASHRAGAARTELPPAAVTGVSLSGRLTAG